MFQRLQSQTNSGCLSANHGYWLFRNAADSVKVKYDSSYKWTWNLLRVLPAIDSYAYHIYCLCYPICRHLFYSYNGSNDLWWILRFVWQDSAQYCRVYVCCFWPNTLYFLSLWHLCHSLTRTWVSSKLHFTQLELNGYHNTFCVHMPIFFYRVYVWATADKPVGGKGSKRWTHSFLSALQYMA